MTVADTVEKPIDGLQISRVTGSCTQGSVIQNVRNVVLTDIKIDGVSGSAYFTNNVEGTGLDGAMPAK